MHFSETIEACDLKLGRYRRLNDFMKVCQYEKVKTVDFSETIVASDMKVSRIRHLIECMKVCQY